MIDSLPTVGDLIENPYLAILDALERTLNLSSASLLAEYGDPLEVEQLENAAQQAYANALVNQILAMQTTLSALRRSLR